MCTIISHHKLIHWRLVTHCGIDGYSRMIVYLKCSSNNLSATVYDLFLEAAQRYYGLPSRVWSDQGVENRLVTQCIIMDWTEVALLSEALYVFSDYGKKCIDAILNLSTGYFGTPQSSRSSLLVSTFP